MIKKASYSRRELMAECFGAVGARAPLPAPPLLGFDRIVEIDETGGEHGRGRAVAERDLSCEEWFFKCHFRDDPVMPGCLGLDALWQLMGFYKAWAGCRGQGRALGCASVEFEGEIRPHDRVVAYEIAVRRLIRAPQPMLLADGTVKVDGRLIYVCKGLKTGMFSLPYLWPEAAR